MKEFIIFESLMFLNYKDLLNTSIVNKSFHKVYHDHYDHFWEEVLVNSPEIIYIKRKDCSTLKSKNYAYSYSNKSNKQKMLYNFLKHLK